MVVTYIVGLKGLNSIKVMSKTWEILLALQIMRQARNFATAQYPSLAFISSGFWWKPKGGRVEEWVDQHVLCLYGRFKVRL
mgnify:CR=1 FL=1